MGGSTTSGSSIYSDQDGNPLYVPEDLTLSVLSTLVGRPNTIAAHVLQRNYVGGIIHPSLLCWLPTAAQRHQARAQEMAKLVNHWFVQRDQAKEESGQLEDEQPHPISGDGILLFHPRFDYEPLPLSSFQRDTCKPQFSVHKDKYLQGCIDANAAIQFQLEEGNYEESLLIISNVVLGAKRMGFELAEALFTQLEVLIRDYLCVNLKWEQFCHLLNASDLEDLQGRFKSEEEAVVEKDEDGLPTKEHRRRRRKHRNLRLKEFVRVSIWENIQYCSALIEKEMRLALESTNTQQLATSMKKEAGKKWDKSL